jgi:hypothetical protein
MKKIKSIGKNLSRNDMKVINGGDVKSICGQNCEVLECRWPCKCEHYELPVPYRICIPR